MSSTPLKLQKSATPLSSNMKLCVAPRSVEAAAPRIDEIQKRKKNSAVITKKSSISSDDEYSNGDGDGDGGVKAKIAMELDSAELKEEEEEEEEVIQKLCNQDTMKICRVCRREFPSGRALGGHMRVHGASLLIGAMEENNGDLHTSSYSCKRDRRACMKIKKEKKQDLLAGISEQKNRLVNQKEELISTEMKMIRDRGNRSRSCVLTSNPKLLMTSSGEVSYDDDDQKYLSSFLNQDLAMESEEEEDKDEEGEGEGDEEEVEEEGSVGAMAGFSALELLQNRESSGDGYSDLIKQKQRQKQNKQKINYIAQSAELLNRNNRMCKPNLYELRQNPKPSHRFIRSSSSLTLNSSENLIIRRSSAANNTKKNILQVASSSSSMNSSASATTSQRINIMLPIKRSISSLNSSSGNFSKSPLPSPDRINATSPSAMPHSCTECGKAFFSWKALFGHMRCHPERQWRGINRPSNHQQQESQELHSRSDQSIRTVFHSSTTSLQIRGRSGAEHVAESHSCHSHQNKSTGNGSDTVSRADLLTNSVSTGSFTGAEGSCVKAGGMKAPNLTKLASCEAVEEVKDVVQDEDRGRIAMPGRKRKKNSWLRSSLQKMKRRRTMAMVELGSCKGGLSNADRMNVNNGRKPKEEEEEEAKETKNAYGKECYRASSAPSCCTNISFSDMSIKARGSGGHSEFPASRGQESKKSASEEAFFSRNSSSCSSTVQENQTHIGSHSKDRSSTVLQIINLKCSDSHSHGDGDDGDEDSHVISEVRSPCWPTVCKRRSKLRARHSSEFRSIRQNSSINNCREPTFPDSSNIVHHDEVREAGWGREGEEDEEEDADGYGRLMMEEEMQEDVDMANCLVLLSGSGVSKPSITSGIKETGMDDGARRIRRRKRKRRGSERNNISNSLAAVNMADDNDGGSGGVHEDGDGYGKDIDPYDERDENNNHYTLVDVKNNEMINPEEEIRTMAKAYYCATCNRSFSSHQALGGHRASHRKIKGCFAASQLPYSHNHNQRADDPHPHPHPHDLTTANRNNNMSTGLERIHGSPHHHHHHHHTDHTSSSSTMGSDSKKKESSLITSVDHHQAMDWVSTHHRAFVTTTKTIATVTVAAMATASSSSTQSQCQSVHQITHKHSAVNNKDMVQMQMSPMPDNVSLVGCGQAGHECSVCHRIFPSGQALGGHKRCHWITTNNFNGNHNNNDEDGHRDADGHDDQIKLVNANGSELHDYHIRTGADLGSETMLTTTTTTTTTTEYNDLHSSYNDRKTSEEDQGSIVKTGSNVLLSSNMTSTTAAAAPATTTDHLHHHNPPNGGLLLRSGSVNSRNIAQDAPVVLLDLNLPPAPGMDYSSSNNNNTMDMEEMDCQRYIMNLEEEGQWQDQDLGQGAGEAQCHGQGQVAGAGAGDQFKPDQHCVSRA